VVTLCTARFNIHKFYVLPTQCIYVFCVDLRTNSDYFRRERERKREMAVRAVKGTALNVIRGGRTHISLLLSSYLGIVRLSFW
jgi:hypothetical protein